MAGSKAVLFSFKRVCVPNFLRIIVSQNVHSPVWVSPSRGWGRGIDVTCTPLIQAIGLTLTAFLSANQAVAFVWSDAADGQIGIPMAGSIRVSRGPPSHPGLAERRGHRRGRQRP